MRDTSVMVEANTQMEATHANNAEENDLTPREKEEIINEILHKEELENPITIRATGSFRHTLFMDSEEVKREIMLPIFDEYETRLELTTLAQVTELKSRLKHDAASKHGRNCYSHPGVKKQARRVLSELEDAIDDREDEIISKVTEVEERFEEEYL